jgi:hypothetical protein
MLFVVTTSSFCQCNRGVDHVRSPALPFPNTSLKSLNVAWQPSVDVVARQWTLHLGRIEAGERPKLWEKHEENLLKMCPWESFSMLVRVNCLSLKSIPRKDWTFLSAFRSRILWNTLSDWQLT